MRPALLSAALNELRSAYELAPDPQLMMLSRHLVLSPFAPSFRDPTAPLPRAAHSFRPAMPDADPAGDCPAWLAAFPTCLSATCCRAATSSSATAGRAPVDVRAGAEVVLHHPGYRTAADRIRDEVAELPGRP